MILCKTVFEYSKIKMIILLSFIINAITMYLQEEKLLFMIIAFTAIFTSIIFIVESIITIFKYKKYLNVEKELTVEELEEKYKNNKNEIDYLNHKNILLEGKIKSINIEKKFFVGTNINIVFLTNNNINIESSIKNVSYKFKKCIERTSENNKLVLIGRLNIENNNLILEGVYLRKY